MKSNISLSTVHVSTEDPSSDGADPRDLWFQRLSGPPLHGQGPVHELRSPGEEAGGDAGRRPRRHLDLPRVLSQRAGVPVQHTRASGAH